MPKQPLRTNQIVSKLKAASSPVVHGTATNAIDALQLSLDSPTPIGAWVCQTTEGEKSLSVIDLGSSAYLGLDIDPKLGYINCYLASGAIVGNGDKGNQIKGPLFHFLSREDVNDTATQLTTAEGGNDPVIANPSGEATAELEKLQVGETIFEISASNVYELTLSAADSADLLTYMQGTTGWSITLPDIDLGELVEYAAIKVRASVAIESDVVNVECLLVKLAELDVNSIIAQAAFVSSDPVQLNAETTLFTIRIATEEDMETGDLNVVLSGEVYAIKDSDITSELSTAGQVLTSDGQGGCSWQAPAGGSGTVYYHYLYIRLSKNGTYIYANCLIPLSSNTLINTKDAFTSMLYNLGFKATGFNDRLRTVDVIASGTNSKLIDGVVFYSDNGTTLTIGVSEVITSIDQSSYAASYTITSASDWTFDSVQDIILSI